MTDTKETIVYAVCEANIAPGWVQPFTLAKVGADGKEEPFPILIVRDEARKFYAYVNACPHEKKPLYEESENYVSDGRRHLHCMQHDARFEPNTGLCVEGDCKFQSLESIPVAIIDGDVCIAGVELAEDDDAGPPPIMIVSE
ncbi:Rieske 2Fe-2S domain-containing protein [Rhodomicrobium sp. Az07]|uniref:Rieske (2Fe-2S) protein n=1 Tax=Rhodomicrobium sp. Az07 TaxID=2839034 RepID=UPI001BE88018|nr:Rieske 2Fe-2S domain-containing protein [Rhodomicrobium sp. Az07]MBT3069689.1 Rieske 2Fe-2S domain-containing protein [Rhodomicrobium sp. Az07]